MKHVKIHELPIKDFDNETIDNCFYVKDVYAPVYRVKMIDIFNWIKEKAEHNGLTIELKDNNLMFIIGSKEQTEKINIDIDCLTCKYKKVSEYELPCNFCVGYLNHELK